MNVERFIILSIVLNTLVSFFLLLLMLSIQQDIAYIREELGRESTVEVEWQD